MDLTGEKIKELTAYRESDAVSQSFLKNVLNNDIREKKESTAMFLGSLVDCYALTPELVPEFYHISKIEKYPTESIKQVIDKKFELGIGLEEAIEECNYQPNWKKATKIEKVKSEGGEYLEELETASGKVVVSKEFNDKCYNAALTINADAGKHLTIKDNLVEEIKFQEPLYWDYTLGEEVFKCKGLADVVYFNHAEREIVLRDLKTTSLPMNQWKYQYCRAHRLDFQMAFYHKGLSLIFPDYTIKLPEIILYNWNTNKVYFPTLSLDDLFIGRYGAERVRSKLIFERDEEGTPVVESEETEHINGYEDALYILHKSKLLGLSDYDLENYNKEINIWL